MKYTIQALAVICALGFADSASAQIVNGNNGANGSPEAPIGTKAGGSNASMNAPGEAAAKAGAEKNVMDEKQMQNSASMQGKHKRHKVSAMATGQ